MSGPLAEWLSSSAGQGAHRVWLKSSAYTKRLLLGATDADPWTSAATYLAYFSQAQGLLRPDVAVIEVGDLVDAFVRREGGLAGRLGSRRRPALALRKLLEPQAPKALLSEVVGAVLSHLRGQTPLVLAMPSPRSWLLHANRLAGGSDDEVDTDAVEDAAMYVADLMRAVAAHPVAGLLLEEQTGDHRLSAADVANYRSVLNVAGHYRWSVVHRLSAGTQVPAESVGGFDAVIAEAGAYRGTLPVGDDVSRAFAAEQPAGALQPGQFYFVEIAPGQRPETVLDQLARLRTRSE